MTSLVGVRTALKLSGTEHAATLTKLVDSGKLVPYKSKEGARQRFGLEDGDYPSLGKKQSPASLRDIFSPKKLQEMCLRDLPEAREYFGSRLNYFFQSDPADNSAETEQIDAGTRTILNLTNTDPETTQTIVTFPSETLEQLCAKDWEPPENHLRASVTTCTVLPDNTLLPLYHSNEGTTVVTLLTGSLIWIIWPSTSHNLRTLQTAYEGYTENVDETTLDVAHDLEGGMTFVQGEGDGLRIPPLCPIICLSTKTTVLATYSEITVDDFLDLLPKLSLLNAWFQTERDGRRKQAEFNVAFLRHLDLMLNGDPDDEEQNRCKLNHDKGGLLDALLKMWDDVKEDVAALMGPADRLTMEKIWETFLIGVKGRECRICGKRISNKQRLMKAHFVANHWSKAKEAKRVDSMEAHGVDTVDGQRTGWTVNDAMDVN
ncbi:hypothetical protein GQ44DRAFT_823135 [Phaeosphaeriaceae sp. PMI808]|nr:hypothetical protein GQ44DRAFT_823135 [Phaeosphaeriaceae sp. PMI808]